MLASGRLFLLNLDEKSTASLRIEHRELTTVCVHNWQC